MHSTAVHRCAMSTRRAPAADRRAVNRALAALVAAVLALTVTTLTRSATGQHHGAHAKAVVGVSAGDSHHMLARLDPHAVADRTATDGRSSRGHFAATDVVAVLDSRGADAARVRGPPGRTA